jgi:D-alanyl-lipoteichoic acid acyltransferase DltB (MBOAT superfamily)
MNWKPSYALLLLTSTAVTFFAAIGIGCVKERSKKRCFLVASIVINLAILFQFKYYNFLASNILEALQYCNLSIHIPEFDLLLPVGISFYTFQALGYSIDVYRGTTKVEHDFFTYALFVSFFPQLVAGPIERSNNLLTQFRTVHRFDYDRVLSGIRQMVWGYFIKLVLADRCAIYVNLVFNHVGYHHGGSYLLASLLFPFQIYGDFAGYSLIAIGVANVLGFRLMENFRRPYMSCSVGEFWHRWHISLSTWFKDYVYIPLGGNRVSRWRNYFNLLITFMISGIWHGANWTFLCWGSLHGLLLCIEKALGIGKYKYSGISKFFHMIMTFVIVSFAWIFFRANNLNDAFEALRSMVMDLQKPNLQYGILIAATIAIFILLLKELATEYRWHWYEKAIKSRLLLHIYLILIISYIIIFGVFSGDQFIYFQF